MPFAEGVRRGVAPRQAAPPSCRPCIRSQAVAAVIAGYRQGSVARQPVVPILPADAELAAEQERAKTGAIDEEVACDPFARLHRQGEDRGELGVAFDGRHPYI